MAKGTILTSFLNSKIQIKNVIILLVIFFIMDIYLLEYMGWCLLFITEKVIRGEKSIDEFMQYQRRKNRFYNKGEYYKWIASMKYVSV